MKKGEDDSNFSTASLPLSAITRGPGAGTQNQDPRLHPGLPPRASPAKAATFALPAQNNSTESLT